MIETWKSLIRKNNEGAVREKEGENDKFRATWHHKLEERIQYYKKLTFVSHYKNSTTVALYYKSQEKNYSKIIKYLTLVERKYEECASIFVNDPATPKNVALSKSGQNGPKKSNSVSGVTIFVRHVR